MRVFSIFFLANMMLQSLPGEVARGTLRGRVSDPSGRSVPWAKIHIEPGQQSGYSDAAGEFAFAVAPGDYRLTATSADFEPVTLAPVPVTAGGDATVTLRFQQIRTSPVQVEVIGAEPDVALREIPGSASLVSRRDLEDGLPADANQVLRWMPGVHVREDSGPVGMRLNIGIRGLNPDRSRTLLVLEDGLPLALAPYGEPEMYYSPPIDRMSRVELLKGSGSIVHGPQTIGGVLNFITPDPPPQPQGTLELTGGQWGFFRGQASYGGTWGRTGWHVNLLRKQGDGWRGFLFDINDLTSKLNVELSSSHKLGLKLGVYDERSNSTYLGLTESQFRSNPDFNPVPDDLLRVRRYSGSLAHQFVMSPNALLTTTVFGYNTGRNWRRQDFDRSFRSGVEYLKIVGDPSIPGGAIFLRNSARSRNREFDVIGADTRLSVDLPGSRLRHRLETGFRYVHEEHRDREIDGEHYMALAGVLRSDEARNGRAFSGFVQDRIFVTNRLTITPGLRIENYEFTRDIRRQPVGGVPTDVSVRGGDEVMKAIPGLGAALQAAGPLTLFTGIHRGFAPPRVKDAITRDGESLQLDAELSWNVEAGARLHLERGIRAEATFFHTDFQNQIIPASQSGGATTTLINAGETLHRGMEFSVGADWSRLIDPRLGVWTELRHTYLPVARFTAGIYDGNRLPYAPGSSFGVRAGYRHAKGFSLYVDGTRVADQFGDNEETVRGSAGGTVGLLPGYWVWNLSAGQEVRRERYLVSPFVTVKNLGDARYISSRAPLGIQPGMFRQATGGLRFRF